MRSKEPWRLDAGREAYDNISSSSRATWKLFHYISGGGMRTFGRTLEQDSKSRRQSRFLVCSAVLLLVWLTLRYV